VSAAPAVQLPLGLGLRDGPSLANFEPGPNGDAVRAVCEAARGTGAAPRGARFPVFVWGGAGTGKTHLLEAACREASVVGRGAAYVPLAAAGDLDPALLAGLEALDLVCVDDAGAVAGRREWEEALLHLYNRCERAGAGLLLAAAAAPSACGIGLADLASRLAAGLVYRLRALDDEGRRRALQARARGRGFALPDDVAGYLLRRHSRDLHALFALLERIDRSTLEAKRKVTVPFVRALLEGGEPR